MINKTACPLDCYDACSIEFDTKIKPSKDNYTQGFLCSHMNHYEDFKTIQTPRYKGKDISYEKAYNLLFDMLDLPLKNKILHYRGSGNFGLMQGVTDHFFSAYGATLTDGSLCDSAGESGIIQGRGSNKNMPMSEIAKSDVIIFWGRNPHTTSSHLLPLIHNKKVIVIDPLKTQIAKQADLHIQLRPHSDLDLALLFCRFLLINDSIDEEYLKRYASEYEDFYELTQSIRIKAKLEEIDVSLGEIGDFIHLVAGKKVAIVCGVGVQKYSDGADILRAIDSVSVFLGLFSKEGCGVSYLANSTDEVASPFAITNHKKESCVNTMFSNYHSVFIQGANPLSQMPNTQRVKHSLEKVQNIIYFGLYENETSDIADLVIPAKSFLYKNDIRVSYAHHNMIQMNKVAKKEEGISEYDLSAKLCTKFNIKLESENFYIDYFKSFSQLEKENTLRVKNREDIVYKNGFDTDNGEFIFLEEYENTDKKDDKYFLISPKSSKSLNSQFQREKSVYLHSSLGFKQNQSIKLKTYTGEVILNVIYNDDLRKDCILVYSGTKGLNNITSSRHSLDGKCAIFQENKVEISAL